MKEDDFTNEYSKHVPPTKPPNWFQQRRLEKEEIKVRACSQFRYTCTRDRTKGLPLNFFLQ